METSSDRTSVHVALHSLMNSVCNYLECQVSGPLDIDDVLRCKLDQAADLIKKHLLCSVREDMEVMKGKLSDLEMKIYRLEMENTLLLREYVPAEILEQRRRMEETDDRWSARLVDSSCSCSCSFDQRQSIVSESHELERISVTAGESAALTLASASSPGTTPLLNN